ncbi:Eukaryotic peptide chain release factor GTP-binding subunit [Microsporum ferrugineum]
MASSDTKPDASDSHLPPPTPQNARIGSYISSQMSSAISEDGQRVQHPASWSQPGPPQSRRGPPPLRNPMLNTNTRPPSAQSKMSKTHVSSLTSQAFFRPMSSQRLQAQRGGRPTTTSNSTVGYEDNQSDVGSQARRSMVSNATAQLDQELRPPSRGTEFTDPILPDRMTANASPSGHTTLRSLGDNVRLLNDRSHRSSTPVQVNLGENYTNPSASHEPPSKSPMSFPSGLLGGNTSDSTIRRGDQRNHTRLASNPTSIPEPEPEKLQEEPVIEKGRNFEYFTGNTAFFGGGRFQNTRDRPVNILTAFLIILPSILFFAFSAPWLWKHLSPGIPIVFAYILYLCFSSFLHASLVDPGILPRNLHTFPPTDPSADPLALGPPTSDWVMIKLATSDVAAMDVPVKYCKTCSIWRPPRCYHCRVCNNCVETLDHHCVWLNNCVGRRNYRYFFSFVASSTLLAIFLFAASLAHILSYKSQEGVTFAVALQKWRVPFAMVIYGGLAATYPASLAVYHIFLMGRGETTREYLNSRKFKKEDRHRPFTQGDALKNLGAVLGKPRTPSYLQFKKPHIEGDQRFATYQVHKRRTDIEAQNGGLEMQQVSNGHPSNASGTLASGTLASSQNDHAAN